MTHAINDIVHWYRSRSTASLLSIDHITRMAAYSDEKAPERKERERIRETGEEGVERQKGRKINKYINKQINK